MGAVTDAISAMKVQQWGRTTLADGQWLQEKTFKQLDDRDIRLANEIDSINERIPTSGSSYDGLIPWITDGNLERNPLYVITDNTGTRLQNGASGDKQFYVAPNIGYEDKGRVFGVDSAGKAKWVEPLSIKNWGSSLLSPIENITFDVKQGGDNPNTLLKAGNKSLGSTVPIPDAAGQTGYVPVARYDSTTNRGYFNLEQNKDYRLKELNPPSDSNVGQVLTVTSGADGAYVDWKTAPGTVEFRTLQSYSSDQNKKIVKVSTFTLPKTNAKYYGTVGFSADIPGSYSIVPLSGDAILHGMVYESQCINLRNVPSGQMCHYNFYFNADDPNKPFTRIGIKGDGVTSAANVEIDYCSVFYQE